MCGINGFASIEPTPQERDGVRLMNARMTHRGPDDGGDVDLPFATLAMRRLSILDIERGRQPMASADGRFQLVYNGEIYDNDAERKRLIQRGATFRTTSDTEVLLQRLMRDGSAALPELKGMFAFALADTHDESLLLGRDPMGIKPLYWFQGPKGELIFSSELQSLLQHPSIPRRLDHASLEMLLHDRYVADPWTLIQGVQQLPPGHWLRWKAGKVELGSYFEFRIQPDEEWQRDGMDGAARMLRDMLDRVVRSQLEADVPVGVLLSGGVDSSTVTAMAARARAESGSSLQSFSIGFTDPAYDESSIAREVAEHLGTEHHEEIVEDGGFDLEFFDKILDHVGQPTGDTSIIPTWMVSQLAARHTKVVLSGDGGDELFGGYDHIQWAARVRRTSDMTSTAMRRLGRAVLERALPATPALLATPARRAVKGLNVSLLPPEDQLRRLRCLWTPTEIGDLCTHKGAGRLLRPDWRGEAPSLNGLEPEEQAMSMLATTFLPGAILTKVDRASMAASLEVRPPLLDQRIVQLASSLPLGLKIRKGERKAVLREAGRPFLPASIYAHKKQGFSIPLQRWFNADFWGLFDEVFGSGKPGAGLFKPAMLQKTVAEARSNSADSTRVSVGAAATRAWILASVGRWMQRYGVQSV